jgi:hypothetical protein
MKYILCCLSAFVCAESIAAYTYVTNVIDDVVWIYRIDGHEAVVLQAELSEPQSLDVRKTVAIPETVAGTNVRAVAGGTFNASHWLQSVRIPASVTQIGMNAFANCSNLVSVTIEHDGKSFGLSRINRFAFGNCVSLVDINLTNAIHLSMIDRGAFSGCKSLKFIALPECCRRLDEFVFRGCENLREVMLPVTVEEVPGSAFIECVRLREIKIAPGGNFLFENGVLYDKTKRKLIRCLLDDHVQSVKIEEGIMGIMPNAFGGCKHLKNVILPSTLKHIGEFAFCGSGLKEIVLPEGLESIGYAAFADTTVKLDGRWVHVNEL